MFKKAISFTHITNKWHISWGIKQLINLQITNSMNHTRIMCFVLLQSVSGAIYTYLPRLTHLTPRIHLSVSTHTQPYFISWMHLFLIVNTFLKKYCRAFWYLNDVSECYFLRSLWLMLCISIWI